MKTEILTYLDAERQVKAVTRPCVPGEMTRGLADCIGYSHHTQLGNCLNEESDRCLTVGRWWYLLDLLDDYRPAIAMMADAGYAVHKAGGRQPEDIEKALVISIGRLLTALAEAKAPESEGGEDITPNEMKVIRPLGMDIQYLVALLMRPADTRYSMGPDDVRMIHRILGEE